VCDILGSTAQISIGIHNDPGCAPGIPSILGKWIGQSREGVNCGQVWHCGPCKNHDDCHVNTDIAVLNALRGVLRGKWRGHDAAMNRAKLASLLLE